MKLTLKRQPTITGATLGRLYVDGLAICFTMEDEIRPEGIKIYGQTAIPAGKYNVTLTMSNRFKRKLPLVEDVPGFSGIRIHPGNTKADTEGCILPGMGHSASRQTVYRSQIAFNILYREIDLALVEGDKVTLEIINL